MKTVNRRTFTVDTPSGSDVKDYFFNHYNWKGMSDDKNFLTADQETFESCSNVYMDSEGLLRSRPSVKRSKIDGNNVQRIWSFVDILVYCKSNDNGFELVFLNKFGELLKSIDGFNSTNINLVLKDGKIFIFSDTPGKFLYFNTETYDVLAATSYVYIPETTINSAGELEGESRNMLSLAEITVYIYSSSLTVSPELDGKIVKVLIDDIEYEFEFDIVDSPVRLYEKLGTISEDSKIFYENGIFAKYEIDTGDLSISTDCESWTSIGTNPYSLTTNYYGLSTDGLIFYIVTTEMEMYAISTQRIEDGYEYSVFTRVNENIINSSYVLNIAGIHVHTESDYVLVCKTYDATANLYNTNILYVNSGTITKNYNRFSYDSEKGLDVFEAVYNPLVEGKFDTILLRYFGTGRDFIIYKDGVEQSIEYVQEFTKVYSFLSKDFVLFEYFSPITSNCRYWIYQISTGTSTRIFDSDFVSNLMETESNAVLFDDGKYLALPIGIYSLANNRLIPYLNVLNSQIAIPLCGTDYLYYRVQNSENVYTNYVSTPIELKVESRGEVLDETFVKTLSESVWSQLDSFYTGNNQILYISEARYNTNGEFLWYFPKINEQRFNYNITGLYPISTTEMGIFFANEIWYSTKSENIYYYNKSKLQVGLKPGGNVIGSYDGTSVIFAGQRGLVALSYQDFVASTDQALTFLSDAIHNTFIEYCKNPVKICRFQYWYICYNDYGIYVYDVRTNAWWPMSASFIVNVIDDFDNSLVLLVDGQFCKLSKDDSDYYDDVSNKKQIDWYIKSQKLHLNAVNYYKHIANLTLLSVLDSDKEMSFMMEVNNYRKKMNKAEIQTVEFRVDAIRTFVKRVSYPKVNEFQYIIHQDDEQAIRLPLSLSGITIKYRVGGQVR